eukprot:SAG31_NODE_480_length_15108_cov_56.073423_18_plen_148_part_00
MSSCHHSRHSASRTVSTPHRRQSTWHPHTQHRRCGQHSAPRLHHMRDTSGSCPPQCWVPHMARRHQSSRRLRLCSRCRSGHPPPKGPIQRNTTNMPSCNHSRHSGSRTVSTPNRRQSTSPPRREGMQNVPSLVACLGRTSHKLIVLG